ncbi:SDR family NAD(P)-dependent oxidoreductase [Furfurilactobacillus curtus]|uniref:Carbonyl reductase n=1 Tax=Furfurilactobacillus curtus TaxID=1746200 RepID=A0ABQ5JRY6_9LACO
MTETQILTLVTGGNRGMGLELVKQLSQAGQRVLMGSRNLDNGVAAVKQLGLTDDQVTVIQLDVTDPASVTQAAQTIENKFGYLTTLINNAGAVFDGRQAPSQVNLDDVRADFELNYFGLIDVTEKMIPLLEKSSQAKIINISSMMGSKTAALDPTTNVYQAVAVGYQSAKAAANMYTVQLAKEFQRRQQPITVNATDPGMIATAFGSGDPEKSKAMGALPIEDGVVRTMELATDFTNQATATFTNSDGAVGW